MSLQPAAVAASASSVSPSQAAVSKPAHRIVCACQLSRRMSAVSYIFQGIAAAVLAQTLFFKFTAAPESVYIFTKLGAEPWGRIGSGVAELIAVLLLLTPRTAIFGAAMSIGVMFGAIASHLGPLGIVVQDDGGLLFALAWTVLLCGVAVLVIRRDQVQRFVRQPIAYIKDLATWR
jgi:hypothetical protein